MRPLPPLRIATQARRAPAGKRPPIARMYRHGITATAVLLLAACSAQPDAPGAVTADEARQLNDAAMMLDANSVDADAVTLNESDQ